MSKRLAVIAIGISGLTRIVAAQTAPVQTDGVTFYDFAGIPQTGPLQARAVVTDTVSFIYAVIPPRWHQAVHYHEQEQISMGLEGAVRVLVGGGLHPLGARLAVIPPANVEHGMVNDDDTAGKIVEFDAIRRPDWLPSHAPVTIVKSPQPVPLSDGQQIDADMSLSAAGWERLGTGARRKALVGKTIRLTTWDLSEPNASADLASGAVGDRFLFVLQGRVSIVSRSGHHELSEGGLALLAASAQNIEARSSGIPAVVAVFESLRR